MRSCKVLALLIACLVALSVALSPGVAAAAPGPSEAPEWWFDAWKVPTLWSSGADGRGITVAVIDSGVEGSIPELQGKVVAGSDYTGNGTDGRTDFDGEAFSHGTAMASIIAASKGYGGIEGIAPGVKILPIAVPLTGVSVRGKPDPNAITDAIRYAADHGAKVISMSLGGTRYQGEDDSPCPSMLQDAVIYALRKGSIVVAASGNSGQNGSPVEQPGVCLGVVSVGAVDPKMNVSSFSSRHPYLTVSAPGDDIPTLSRVANQAYIGGGTSQATAMTSAAIAMVWSKFPSEKNSQIVSRIIHSAIDRGPSGRDAQYGYGVIDPNAAVKADSAVSKSTSVFDDVAPLVALADARTADLKTLAPQGKAAAGNPSAPIGVLQVGTVPSVLGLGFYVLLLLTVLLLIAAVALVIIAVRRKPRPPIVQLSPA
ncbi:MAG TPA: S8 family serine peptidase [Jatrophihabitans sp.]